MTTAAEAYDALYTFCALMGCETQDIRISGDSDAFSVVISLPGKLPISIQGTYDGVTELIAMHLNTRN